MKVVVVSPYRSATQSTDALLKNLGYKTLHYGGHAVKARSNILDRVYNIIPNYDAFSDNPFPIMYEHFDTQYPDSKFILIKRDPDSWYNSILAINTFLKKPNIDPFERIFFEAYLDKVPKKFKDISYEDYILCYNRHIEAVENYFKDKDNLLVLDISDTKKGIKIADFLDKDIFPKVDFIK